MYKAGSLPPELVAAKPTGLESIDYTRLASSNVNSDLIYPGDLLEITIATGAEERAPTPWQLRLAEDGTVNLPLIGPLQLAGVELNRADQLVRAAGVQRGVYRNPYVSVLLKERRSNRVTVVGAVNEPGVYNLPAIGSDLLAAIVTAGGLAEDASSLVDVRHPPGAGQLRGVQSQNVADGGQVSPVSFNRTEASAAMVSRLDLADTRSVNNSVYLADGSVVTIRPREPRVVNVIGLVRKPSQIELSPGQDVRVLDAIAMAGGRTLQIADKVNVIRRLPDQDDAVVIGVSVKDAKKNGQSNVRLAAGDVVSVEETPVTMTVDTIRSFVRFGFSSALPGF